MTDFEALYRDHAPHVRRYAEALCGNAAQADDLTAETFVRVWLTRDRLRHETLRAFLFAIVRNLHLSGVRAAWRRVPLEDVHADPAPDPAVRAAAREDGAALVRALSVLAPTEREVLVLRSCEGLSYEAIGQLMGITAGAARVRVHRARARLLSLMEQAGSAGRQGEPS